MSVSYSIEIDVEDFYDNLYDSDKEELVDLLNEDGFLHKVDVETSDIFKVLRDNYFRFTKEDEDLIDMLFKKYNV